MKIRFRLLCFSFALLSAMIVSPPAQAQKIGGDLFQGGAVQPFMSNLNVGWRGRAWIQANAAEEGLGYEGPYVSLGTKSHIFQDFLDGRWLLESRGHYALETEGFFGNVGLERVFSVESAGAEVRTSFWFDYDDSLDSAIAEEVLAVGLSASIDTRRMRLSANAYEPIGTSDFVLGDPTHANCFFGNNIVTQAAIDTALSGFDAILEFKPANMEHVNGSFGVGGYSYSSDLVESFAGVRARFGLQTYGGAIVTAEINHDDRFDFTGVLQLGWLFGAGARGTEYGFLGNDLQPTHRNDHVAVYHQDLRLAIDPDTGRAYNVIHVDNSADAAFGNGSAETPFTTLAAAEAAGATDDIIFVREGNGTVFGMDQGIALLDGQLLLGDGVQHLIPLADGTNFVLCNDIDGNRPTITNTAGDAVTLANRNTVRGFNISGANGSMQNGIFANGFVAGAPIMGGTIEDNIITGAILNGVFLNDISGNWEINRNNIQMSGFDGIAIANAGDPTSIFNFNANNVSNNVGNGIHIADYDAMQVNFINNITNGNGFDGILLERFINSTGNGIMLDFINPVSSGNDRDGISVVDAEGNVRFINSNIQNNDRNGINLVDVRTPGADQQVFIGTSGGGASVINGNGIGTGAGIFNSLNTPFSTQQLFITNSQIDNGGAGIDSSANAIAANLTTTIIDNISISGNQSNGVRLASSNGALHTATVVNTVTPLQMNNNQGNGVALFATSPGSVSLLEVDLENLTINGSGDNAIQANVSDEGQIIARANNIGIAGAGNNGIQINAANNASTALNQFTFDNITLSGVANDGAQLNVFENTFVDFALFDSTFNNIVGGVPTGDHGIEANVVGETDMNGNADGIVDSRLRLLFMGNTISNFNTGDGIGVLTAGDAHAFVQIEGNTITGNGIDGVVGTPNVPFNPQNGIDLTASQVSAIFTRITNNAITGSGGPGLDLNTLDEGQVSALVSGNFISGNDLQEDPATLPLEALTSDMTVTNATAGSICLAMSNNFFNLFYTNPVLLTNNSGPNNFTVELDGLSNGIGVPTFAPDITQFDIATFGTICSPAIDIEDAAFEAAGFPPLP